MGKWGVRLSAVGLGSYLTIGFKCDEKTSRELVKAAYDAGINFFDTANAYAAGNAEKVLGRCLADFPRSSIFLMTKVFGEMGKGPNDRGLSAKHIREQCDASLERLGMDYIDAYMCHRADPDTPLEETIRAMKDLARAGKIIYWGISEWPIAAIGKAQAVAKEVGARPISVSQPRYSLLYRYPEKELFPLTLGEGIGNVIFSPLAHGMLTGKYKPGEEAPAGTRASDPDQNAVIKGLYWSEENKKKAQTLVAIAKDLGVSAAQLSIAWCLKHPALTSVILGATRAEQVKENVAAVDIEVPDEVMKKLDTLFPPVTDVPTA
jgi:aryl-alcohol dehydrogenase-like predicted oxidoreductase